MGLGILFGVLKGFSVLPIEWISRFSIFVYPGQFLLGGSLENAQIIDIYASE